MDFISLLGSSRYNLSSFLAPTRYPCIRFGGTLSWELNPKRYKWLEIPTEVVNPTSIGIQSIFDSGDITDLGVIIEVI